MTTFRVGQTVRIVSTGPARSGPGVAAKVGTLATIATPARVLTFDLDVANIKAGTILHDLKLEDGREASAPDYWLEPYHEPGDYQTLSELLRGVVPAGVKEETT